MKMNHWENMYIQIYGQQDQLITEQQINELNPLYELAQLPHAHYERVHKQITNRQEHQTCTDDIHMRPHTA